MTDVTTRVEASWRGLFTAPAGPRTRVSAAVARRIFDKVVRRFGIRMVPGQGAERLLPHLGPEWDEPPTIVLHRPEEFFARVGRHGLIGFGEAYMTGAWDSPDLARLLTELSAEMGSLVPERLQRLRRVYVARHPRLHRNTERNTQANVSHHYDLSNDLFAVFLDDTLTYSSALFDAPVRPADAQGKRIAADPGSVGRHDLAAAQIRKIDRLLDQTGVAPGSRVLEIGTGWGELAIRAARRGARVRSVTLSREQQLLAQQRIAAAGVPDRVEVELADYRQVRGEYDAVISVEMVEAVGHEYLPAYFQTIHDRLAPGGRAGIQAILMGHDRMLATLGTFTWINKYIFPGGFLPSVELVDSVASDAGLRTVDRLCFGRHYAETLRLWDERFLGADLEPLGGGARGFDEVFRRMWHFYLTYSRAGFASGYLDVAQLSFLRTGS